MKAFCAVQSASGGRGRGIKRDAVTLSLRPDFKRSCWELCNFVKSTKKRAEVTAIVVAASVATACDSEHRHLWLYCPALLR